MSFLKQFPQISALQDLAARRESNVYLVGGFLRDHLLKRLHTPTNPFLDVDSSELKEINIQKQYCRGTNHDLDFAVDRGALDLARAFADAISAAFFILDQERGCARVVVQQSGGDLTFDFSDFRAPSLEEDLSLRDFTVNTLCVALDGIKPDAALDSLIKDSHGGVKDLKSEIIRRVSERSLLDDPLRLLRAFSLRAQMGFQIEEATLQQIRELKDTLRPVSYERIRDELFKVLESPRAGRTIREMDAIGLLEKIIPQIRVMFDCHQGGYHHLDVWPHTLEALDQFETIIKDFETDEDIRGYLAETIGGTRSRAALTKLGILLHDIGKPDTRKVEDNGRMSFHSHENVGKGITHHVADLLKLSNEERHALEDMVQWHLRPGYLSNEETPSERSIYRYFRDAKEEGAGILLLSLADQRATRGPLTSEGDQKHHEDICLNLVKRFFDKRKEVPFVPLINGHDLIQMFGLKPSPLIGEILKDVHERQALGEIATRQEALQQARILALKTK